MTKSLIEDGRAAARAAEALLREHPDALVCGLAGNGLIVPVPQAVGLWGQGAIEGRALIDGVVAADREVVVKTWLAARAEGAAEGKVRLLDRPSRWVTLHFVDLREDHDVLLGILIPGEEVDGEQDTAGPELEPAKPRFATITEDEAGMVLDVDDAFVEMFGYTAEELIGEHVLDQIHPEEQGRAVEGWLAMLSTRRTQATRLRRRRKDGSWVWVDTTLHNYLNQPDKNYVLVEVIDASAEMAAQEALQEREELLRRLTDAMPVGMLHVDSERQLVYNNARLIDILYGGPIEQDEEEPRERDAKPALDELLRTLTDQGLATFDAALDELLAEGRDHDVEVDIMLPSGSWRRALLSMRALFRNTGEVSGAITCVLDVTDSVRARLELEHRATFDALTLCHNRSSILGAVQQELEREDTRATAVVYLDLDNFKPVNDTHGHAAGDELLALVAERLRTASHGRDDVGRLGGDEFIVLLRDIPGADMAMEVAERVREEVQQPFMLATTTMELRASIGVACSSVDEGITADELIKRADSAMYQSKQARAGMPVLAAAGEHARA
jgi:diguanylate cyclase (GGDEF)-like protein/PAS domain S-box-containing protein